MDVPEEGKEGRGQPLAASRVALGGPHAQWKARPASTCRWRASSALSLRLAKSLRVVREVGLLERGLAGGSNRLASSPS